MKNARLTPTARSAGAHRINVGLTLLALIFLTVMVAAAGVRASRSRASVVPRGETLAVLGVAPGSGDVATVPARRPAPVPQAPHRSR